MQVALAFAADGPRDCLVSVEGRRLNGGPEGHLRQAAARNADRTGDLVALPTLGDRRGPRRQLAHPVVALPVILRLRLSGPDVHISCVLVRCPEGLAVVEVVLLLNDLLVPHELGDQLRPVVALGLRVSEALHLLLRCPLRRRPLPPLEAQYRLIALGRKFKLVLGGVVFGFTIDDSLQLFFRPSLYCFDLRHLGVRISARRLVFDTAHISGRFCGGGFQPAKRLLRLDSVHRLAEPAQTICPVVHGAHLDLACRSASPAALGLAVILLQHRLIIVK